MIISLGYRIKSKIVQNKLHFAAHGYTALEVIYKRADDKEPFMGLKIFKGEIPVLQEIAITKNYLTKNNKKFFSNLVSGYFDFVEIQAIRHNPMYMENYIKQLDIIFSLVLVKKYYINSTIKDKMNITINFDKNHNDI